MSDQQFFRKYIDIVNEESPVFQQRNMANSQKWAKENPEAAQYAKLATDVVTDYIPGVSQVKSAYRAGKAALGGDYGEAGKQLVGAFVPGGRRMVSAVDAAGNALKGDYKTAAANLSHAAGGELGRAVSTGLAANDLYQAYGPSTTPTAPATQTAQANTPAAAPNTSATTGPYTPGPALQSLTRQASTAPTTPEPTTEEQELDENGRMRKLLDMLDEAPVTAINPNDPNAAAFGKKINTTSSTTVQPTPQSTPTNVDFQATRSRDRLQQQMASGKINTPAPQTVNPNQKYGGGYDPTKVQYASGNNQAAPTASASQSAALDASKTKAIGGTQQTASAAQSQANQTSKANVIGGGMQQMAQTNQNPSMDPYNPATDPSLQAGYAAVAKPDVEGLKLGVAAGTPSAAQTNQQTQTASTGGGFQGGGYGSVGNQGQTAQVEEEELEEELQKILRLSGKQRQPTNENDSLKKFYNILNEATDNDEIELHDSFDIELNEHFVIETGIIGFTEDGIIIEADETLLGLLEVNNILCEEETTHSKPDTNKKDKPSDYMDTKPATDKRMDTSKLMDKEPLKDKPLKKDPKDYMVHEAPEGWGQDTMTMKDGSVMKYDPKSNSYSQVSGPTRADTKTSVSAVDALRSKATNSSKGDSTYDQEFYSTSVFRDPKTRTGDYLKTQLKGDDYEQDYQTDVSKPWLDYTLDKAKQDADTMMQEPGSYKSMPQGPMAQFRAKVNEAEYQGRKVPLGKPMAGDVAKSKVYVKKPNGKVVKVNFGDKNMKIKKSNPNRRKSFRARHRCENPGPRWKARYWSCRAW
jgi:hypothetical protein